MPQGRQVVEPPPGLTEPVRLVVLWVAHARPGPRLVRRSGGTPTPERLGHCTFTPPFVDHRGRVEPPGRWSLVTTALPVRPDLEHLRREAKQLLRQLSC